MDHGVVKKDGNPADVTRDYALFMSYGAEVPENKWASKQQMNPTADEKNWISTHDMESIGLKMAQIEKVLFLANGRPVDRVAGGEEMEIYLQVASTSVIEQPIFGFVIKDRLGTNILGGNTFVHEVQVSPIATGTSVFKIAFKMPYLTNGEYLVSVALADGTQTEHVQQHWVHDCCVFKVANHEQRFSNGDGLVLEKNFSFLRVESR
jgi:lipopolysaccharide transport system ATP-binding protein